VGGPIIKPLLGKAVVPGDSPYTTGGTGLLGTAPSQEAMRARATLTTAGSSFPYEEFYPKPGKARCVQIDVDAARIGLRYPADVGLVGDCKAILEALVPMIQQRKDRGFLQQAQDGMKKWNELLRNRGGWADKPLKGQLVAHHLDKFIAPDAIIAADCGTVTTLASLRDNQRWHDVFGVRHAGDDGERFAVQRGGGACLSRSPGRLSLRRWRFHHDDGRAADHGEVQAAGENHRLQKQFARSNQVGADGL